MKLKLKNISAILILCPTFAFALPVDWHGSFGVDTTMISDYRRVANTSQNSTGDGTQELTLGSGNKASASFQSYLFRLSPEIIVNDAATLKAEMTTGYADGGFLGDAAKTSNSANGDVNLYYYNQADGKSLNIKKAYLDLNSDTATYHIGRHTYSWALGALYSDGTNAWDRHAYSRDGLTAKFKFNNFHVTPFWSKTSSTGLTKATSTKEIGSSFLYDNKDKDIAFGIYYAKKSSNSFNTFYQSSIGSSAINQGTTDLKITDLYLKKIFGPINFSVEVPLLSGDLGHLVNTTDTATISTKAIIFESNYKMNDAWTFSFNFGDIAGHDGSSGQFRAMYLNPSYKIANLLFNYNLNAVGTTTQSIYDSSITNAQYLKFKAAYSTEKWILDYAFIFAKAKEVAKAGTQSFNHTKNKLFTANYNQEDDLGYEIDFNTKYKWNKEVSIGTGFGYLFTGNYYAYTNTATANKPENSLMLHLNTIIDF